MAQSGVQRVPGWRRLAVALPGLPLAAFFAFVGYYKAFAPVSELLLHHAWTAHVPWWIGRPMGWIELAGAAALVAGLTPRNWPATRIAAAVLAASQIVSAWVHVHNDEANALGQNLFLFLTLGLIAFAARAGGPRHDR